VFAAIQRYNTFGGIVETNGGDLRFPPTALQYLCEEKVRLDEERRAAEAKR
jgi:hypothetical protein